ncbi:hypothetical protein F2Q65_18475 [Thiohalocapsa marina]|uniref:Cytosolic protein n=1 Tax=Thiohalocapsa marina TaxID=424902 RepID=A0A5M8FDW6_9GAMM|nr:hypothetical protein [Thiohalocapsa marina]KAA6182100.1 hypothetical protein F2Q65_18475 [Thiohalocapsa marina]
MNDTAELAPRSDYDSPWKEALEGYFPEFLALLFPHIHAGIDWSRGYQFLDKEFQQIVRDAATGRRYADKLVGVHRLDGQPAWVLVHVEVQGEPEAAFAERMFVYNHKIRDAYGVPVVSLAVLADVDPRFRPAHYRDALWGCAIDFRFPMVKLMDWDTPERWAELEASDNPFALVVMAQIRAKATKDAETRKAWKFRLIRLMYDRGYERKTILELFRVIDWMIRLPDILEASFLQELYTYEESKQMPYVTSAERFGIEKGYRQGEADLLLWQIENKFGADTAEALRERIASADNDSLRRWSARILTADTPEAIFH